MTGDRDPPGSGPSPAGDAAMLRQLIMGFRTTQLIHVAAKLGLVDRLRQGSQTAAQLAAAVDAEPRALHRLLRALAGLGIFAETADHGFTLTPLARLLQADAPGSLRDLAVLYGEEWLWQAYGRLDFSVATGRPAFTQVHGQPFYDYLRDHPAAGAVFDAAMSGYSKLEAEAILAAYDFSGVARVVDVGGGQGALAAALLRAHAHLSAVVLDLAPAVAVAEGRLAAAGLADRATCLAGDFFTAVPPGGDLYLLKSILHNWSDDDAVRILRSCRRAMADRARLLVIERVLPAGNAPAEAKLFDINMLVVVGGAERTLPEYRGILEAAGFSLARILPTQSPVSLIEAVPAEGSPSSVRRDS